VALKCSSPLGNLMSGADPGRGLNLTPGGVVSGPKGVASWPEGGEALPKGGGTLPEGGRPSAGRNGSPLPYKKSGH
jgi:hypothetical protein